MPRFRLTDLDFPGHPDDLNDPDDLPQTQTRRARRPRSTQPRLVGEGRSGRTTADTGAVPDTTDDAPDGFRRGVECASPTLLPHSSYDVATRGPMPAPDWLVTDLAALDTSLGALKSGKEADVTLVERGLAEGRSCLLAVKTYRGPQHRMFHRDAGYTEGRRVRRSRESRAMAKRTTFGRDLLAGKWAGAEFSALGTLWMAGGRVPYPVQLIGSELMMQFIGSPDGRAAPRLAAHDGGTAEFTDLWHDLIATLEILAADGLAHGDLSPYNVLVDDGCVLIDLPQVVDLIGNPAGMTYLRRDCAVIADFFRRRGVHGADGDLLTTHLAGLAMPR